MASPNWRSEPATPLQIDGITLRLAAVTDPAVRSRMVSLVEAGLTKGEANELITWLDKQPGANHGGHQSRPASPADLRGRK